jgi:hypothetical protein
MTKKRRTKIFNFYPQNTKTIKKGQPLDFWQYTRKYKYRK